MLHVLIILYALNWTSMISPVEILDNQTKARQSVLAVAKSLLRTPYTYSGSNPRGFDCSGFTKYVYHRSIKKKLAHSSYLQSKLGKKQKWKKAQPGDLIFFKRKGKINHVAIVDKCTKNELWVYHATSSKGVIRENVLKSPYWKNKIAFSRSIF